MFSLRAWGLSVYVPCAVPVKYFLLVCVFFFVEGSITSASVFKFHCCFPCVGGGFHVGCLWGRGEKSGLEVFVFVRPDDNSMNDTSYTATPRGWGSEFNLAIPCVYPSPVTLYLVMVFFFTFFLKTAVRSRISLIFVYNTGRIFKLLVVMHSHFPRLFTAFFFSCDAVGLGVVIYRRNRFHRTIFPSTKPHRRVHQNKIKILTLSHRTAPHCAVRFINMESAPNRTIQLTKNNKLRG